MMNYAELPEQYCGNEFQNKTSIKKIPVGMKLSEKALRLIGLAILGGMQKAKTEQQAQYPPDNSRAAGYGRPRLTLQAQASTPKARVLAFRDNKPRD